MNLPPSTFFKNSIGIGGLLWHLTFNGWQKSINNKRQLKKLKIAGNCW